MSRHDRDIVRAVQTVLSRRIGPSRFALWFASPTRLFVVEKRLQIVVANRFMAEWLRSRLRGELEASCQEALGHVLPIEFHVDNTLVAETAETSRPEAKPPANGDSQPATAVGGRSRATFETFVIGRTNRLASLSSQTVVQQPGSYSPLLIYGPTGVGKTHLLEAVWTAFRQQFPTRRALYLPAEQFTTSFLEALQG